VAEADIARLVWNERGRQPSRPRKPRSDHAFDPL